MNHFFENESSATPVSILSRVVAADGAREGGAGGGSFWGGEGVEGAPRAR